MAQGGGNYEVPNVSLDWYNLTTGKVETTSTEGFTFVVDAPPTRPLADANWPLIAVVAALLLLGLLVGLWIIRRWGRRLRDHWEAARERRRESEAHAYRQLQQTIARRDASRLYSALDDWAIKMPGHEPREVPDVKKALLRLGEARYGGGSEANTDDAWRELARAASKARKTAQKKTSKGQALPPLNPQSPIDPIS